MLCSCTYILSHTLGMQAFTFQLCVLALCMMHVYIYLLALSDVIVTVHVTQGKEMPNFHSESKVTCCHIFAMEIWYFARMPQESIDWDHTYSKSEPQNPPHMQSLERQCQNHVLFTANLQKIRFYQNKGLSLDRYCRVPNTFSTRN